MEYMDLYTCRTCLSRERKENMKCIIKDILSIHTFSIKISIIEAFYEITRLVVDQNEQVTQLICLNCVRRLRQAMLFRLTAVKSYERLISTDPNEAYPATDNDVKMEMEEEYLDTHFVEGSDEDVTEQVEVKVEYDSMPFFHEDQLMRPPKSKKVKRSSKKRSKSPVYHHKKEKETYICSFCSTEIPNKRSTFLHMKKYHMSKKPYKCWIEGCGRLYVSPAQRRFHQEAIHFKIKPYVCDFCGLCFTDNAKLQSHRRVHTGERPYKCDFPGCTSAFKQPYDYVKHKMSIHSDERKFSCEECGATFKLKGGLRAHKRLMHSKDNLKCCSECTKQFLNAAALNNHIAVVHRGERNHICAVCGKTYAYRKHLIRHIKDSHPHEHQAMKDSGEIISRIKTQLVPVYSDIHGNLMQEPMQQIEQHHQQVKEEIIPHIKTQLVSVYPSQSSHHESQILSSDLILAQQACNNQSASAMN